MGDTVLDYMTGLMRTRKARFGEKFMNWQQGLDRVAEMNREKTPREIYFEYLPGMVIVW